MSPRSCDSPARGPRTHAQSELTPVMRQANTVGIVLTGHVFEEVLGEELAALLLPDLAYRSGGVQEEGAQLGPLIPEHRRPHNREEAAFLASRRRAWMGNPARPRPLEQAHGRRLQWRVQQHCHVSVVPPQWMMCLMMSQLLFQDLVLQLLLLGVGVVARVSRNCVANPIDQQHIVGIPVLGVHYLHLGEWWV